MLFLGALFLFVTYLLGTFFVLCFKFNVDQLSFLGSPLDSRRNWRVLEGLLGGGGWSLTGLAAGWLGWVKHCKARNSWSWRGWGRWGLWGCRAWRERRRRPPSLVCPGGIGTMILIALPNYLCPCFCIIYISVHPMSNLLFMSLELDILISPKSEWSWIRMQQKDRSYSGVISFYFSLLFFIIPRWFHWLQSKHW